MTLSIPPMEPLRREEGWGRFESVGDRGRNGARAAARGDGAPHALLERKKHPVHGRCTELERGNSRRDVPAELEAEAVEGEVGKRIHRRHDLRWGD